MPTLYRFYKVKGNDNVSLNIKIGHAQTGVTSVQLDGQQLAHQHQGSFGAPIILQGPLNRKKLICISTVTDTNPRTNQTSITYELKGGTFDLTETLKEQGKEDRNTFFYTAIFEFYA